jgi:hypothetical protein
MAMKQETQVALVAADGGTVSISRSIAEKIPVVQAFIDVKKRAGQEENVIRIFGDVVEPGEVEVFESVQSLQGVVGIVEDVYKNAPVLQEQYDPQFFEETDVQRAYTPANIPQQVRNIIKQQRSGLSQDALLQAADYVGLNWIHQAVNSSTSKSIADLVVYDELPQPKFVFGQKVLSLKNRGLVSLAGIYLINAETLRSLKIFFLSDNQIGSIEPKDFIGLQNLKLFFISDNHISKIEPQAFAGLQNLIGLDLKGNQINSIDSEMFTGLIRLEMLCLEGNNIDTAREQLRQLLHEKIRDSVRIIM